MENEQLETAVKECDLVVACNINFNLFQQEVPHF